MHPAAALLAWLIGVVALQALSGIWLFVAGGILLVSGTASRQRWGMLLRRSRFLLLTLWLIMAYGVPGEAWLDWAWMPTTAGIDEANLHVARLVVMLGGLAWLFVRLGREQLVYGLWCLCQPVSFGAWDSGRFVVRLALVFDYVERQPARGSWSRIVAPLAELPEGGPEQLHLTRQAWQGRDTALVTSVALGFLLAGMWS